MFRYERVVRFVEVDSAQVVFFARFLEYCHEAVEALLGDLPGGYAGFTRTRDLGVPTVRFEIDFTAPLRYGDVVIVDVDVLSIGRSSITFRHGIRRHADHAPCALARQTVVTVQLSSFEAAPVPEDLRALLHPHVVAAVHRD